MRCSILCCFPTWRLNEASLEKDTKRSLRARKWKWNNVINNIPPPPPQGKAVLHLVASLYCCSDHLLTRTLQAFKTGRMDESDAPLSNVFNYSVNSSCANIFGICTYNIHNVERHSGSVSERTRGIWINWLFFFVSSGLQPLTPLLNICSPIDF